MRHLHAAVVSRLKIMAGLNIAEKRLPHDGRIAMKTGNEEYDLRVSIMPTRHGEAVALRILGPKHRALYPYQWAKNMAAMASTRPDSRDHGIVLRNVLACFGWYGAAVRPIFAGRAQTGTLANCPVLWVSYRDHGRPYRYTRWSDY